MVSRTRRWLLGFNSRRAVWCTVDVEALHRGGHEEEMRLRIEDKSPQGTRQDQPMRLLQLSRTPGCSGRGGTMRLCIGTRQYVFDDMTTSCCASGCRDAKMHRPTLR